MVAVTLGFVLALMAPTGRAAAVDFGATPITAVTIEPTTIAHSGTARVDFTWVAPTGAAAGDTFAITLPDQLEPVSTRAVDLVDAGTSELAVRGTWADKTATFTFQSYVTTRTGVHGTGFFYVRWDHDVTGSPAATFNDLELGGVVLPPITKGAAGPALQNRDASKYGGWATSEQLRFTWVLNFPASTAAALDGPVTVTDVPPAEAGYTFDCGATRMRIDVGGFPSGAETYVAPDTIAGATFTCGDSALTMELDSIPAGTFYTLLVPVAITDQTRTSFDNTASFLWPALNGAPQVEPAEIRRDDAGGTVEADEPLPGTVCIGDLVWEDLDRDGIQDAGEPGVPGVVIGLDDIAADGTVTPVTAAGAPVTQTTDASGLYRFCGLPVLLPGERYRTTIDLDQPALRLFAVTLSGRGTSADDSSAAEASADTVLDLTVADSSDLTLDYGFVRTGSGELANSGASDAAGGLAAAGALIMLAGAALLRRSRRLT